ncbi:pyruvate dehydrogenase E2 component (dihydrolipoamide acetyltransferase) [Dendrobium catenatum]|uniref:Pyruvate dehydrogenase E2 component (Dihydrolipoamide acetyltransferase) n=1 Tax=Dendrobium catenatum TaxID=906689 RepID=A0A2I0XCK9_9ASPA|nr:pyruvate dehydrogenase E2 component (dihydrolipoamide acetyltransferase) [Dendrobium catenatum]
MPKLLMIPLRRYLFTMMQGAASRNMVGSLATFIFRVGYTITTNALNELYKKVDIYSFSRRWKELVDKAQAKQLQPQE